MALDDFVKKNDFTGKTVIPFGTSMSTGDELVETDWKNWQKQETGLLGKDFPAVMMKLRL